MKREIPILLTVLCGLLVTIAFFAPRGDEPGVWQAVNSELLEWARALVAVAYLLGIANLVRINLKQIASRHEDRLYKGLLLVALFGFLLLGLADTHAGDLPGPLVSALVPVDHVELADGSVIEGYVTERGEEQVVMRTGEALESAVIPGASVARISDRSLKLWIFNKVFAPLQATMFSLLAFYVASAAFRAFRARSVEATLLLLAGSVVMLGQVPIGDTLTGGLAGEIHAFLMSNVVKAGQRAIIIGGSLGVLATGLRIVLGLERSYLSE